jgi:hypothetical protein
MAAQGDKTFAQDLVPAAIIPTPVSTQPANFVSLRASPFKIIRSVPAKAH